VLKNSKRIRLNHTRLEVVYTPSWYKVIGYCQKVVVPAYSGLEVWPFSAISLKTEPIYDSSSLGIDQQYKIGATGQLGNHLPLLNCKRAPTTF
jgi:hypothetical protein